MGKKAVTRSLYESILIGFREAPGNYSHAARAACVDRQTAKRAWLFGWPNRPWAPPIEKVLEKERLEAEKRAADDRKREEEADAAIREQSKEAAIEAKKQEATILRGARGDVLAVLVLASELIPAMRELTTMIQDAIKLDPKTGTRKENITAHAAMKMLDQFSKIVSKGVGAAEALIQLSRLDRGEATANVAIGAAKPIEDMTEEDALEELAMVDGILEGMAHHGVLGEKGRRLAQERRKKRLEIRPKPKTGQLGAPSRVKSLRDLS